MADLDEQFIDDLVRKTAGDGYLDHESFHHSPGFRNTNNTYGLGTITSQQPVSGTNSSKVTDMMSSIDKAFNYNTKVNHESTDIE